MYTPSDGKRLKVDCFGVTYQYFHWWTSNPKEIQEAETYFQTVFSTNLFSPLWDSTLVWTFTPLFPVFLFHLLPHSAKRWKTNVTLITRPTQALGTIAGGGGEKYFSIGRNEHLSQCSLWTSIFSVPSIAVMELDLCCKAGPKENLFCVLQQEAQTM